MDSGNVSFPLVADHREVDFLTLEHIYIIWYGHGPYSINTVSPGVAVQFRRCDIKRFIFQAAPRPNHLISEPALRPPFVFR